MDAKTPWKIYLVVIVAIALGFTAYETFKTHKAPTASTAPTAAVKGANQQAQQQNSAESEAVNGIKTSPDIAARRPVAVMVENHPDARPQSGLVDADIIYEALAEGGITRFMAIYQTKNSSNIGPVRSARTYYADIANELGAVYAHVGGNSDVLANIKAGLYKNISDADQFYNGDYFHRITARLAPHNMYTSSAKLQELITARNFSASASYQAWKFKDDAPATAADAKTINIAFSLPDYAVRYAYDASQNIYYRYLAGKPQKDLDSGKQLSAKNVIVQYINTFSVQSDTPLSIGMELEGQGKAVVFEDGRAVEGTWKKDGTNRTRYYDASGNEVALNRGQIWVELVPNDGAARVIW